MVRITLKIFSSWLNILIIFCSISSVFANSNTDKLITNEPSCDPYLNYNCLNSYLGQSFFERFIYYYKLELGHNTAPFNPDAPPPRRKDWPKTPQSTPPMPFTEWPYGGTSLLGVSYPNAVDSPFMVAIENTSAGIWHKNNHIQTYGWVTGGTNLSTNHIKPGGNAPIGYINTPNNIQLDQMALYIERVPDTTQTTNIDWGFRLSGFYGQNYRYTTAYGIASYQLLGNNSFNGYDFPMVYGELYIPNVANGMLFRLGRFISITDIEAQLAPNNYMYTHSMSYTFDNFTNEGLISSIALTNNLITQFGITAGTDTAFWNMGKKITNQSPNPLYPNATFLKDPGAKPSATACIRYTWSDGNNTIYPCINSINNGVWGYNNLQWTGLTYYHKFNSKWHLSYEIYTLFQKNVANLNNAIAKEAIRSGGTPFSPQYIHYNAPNGAQCNSANLTCTARVLATVAYLNYQFSPLDNISFRPEFYDDKAGQRTGVKTRYLNFGIGLQHWLSPQIEFRPEIDYDYALDKNAFNGDAVSGIAPNRRYTFLGAIDVIVHF